MALDRPPSDYHKSDVPIFRRVPGDKRCTNVGDRAVHQL